MKRFSIIKILGVLCVLLLLGSCSIEIQQSVPAFEIDQDVLVEDNVESFGTHREMCYLGNSSVSRDSTQDVSQSALERDVPTSTDSTLPVEESVKPSILTNKEITYPYKEGLVIKPLPNNYLLTSFSFEMESAEFIPGKSSRDFDGYSHYTVFPRAFKPILELTSTRQLHLRFTRGFWDAESWGRLPHDGFKSGGSGVELWAVIEADTEDAAFTHWKTLANSLSGLFCASINFIDSSKTTYPVNSFQPDEAANSELPLFNETKQLHLIHSALANEPICTENLTPFVKLFPTKGKSGFSTLLDGHKVFDSSWHSLSIDIVTECDDSINSCHYNMEALVDVVVNVPKALARSERPIPKPLSSETLRCDLSKPYDAFHCFPLPEETEISYSLSKIYGKHIMGSNLISNHPSRICIDVTDKWNAFIQVDDTYYATDDNCFELKGSHKHDIYLESSDTKSVVEVKNVPIYVSRSLTGYGQDRGGLRTVFNNPSSAQVTLVYFESLPWFMRIYLSTLKLETGDNHNKELSTDQVIKKIHYLPASDRVRPTHLEYTITIPANTSFAISYQFDKSLLKYAEYPPDANHGFEIESAVITVAEPFKYQMRTATLLLLLSTPDFSMPYNVIILTSTVMGLIFGTLFNLMVKRLVSVDEADNINAKSGLKYKLNIMKRNLLSKIGRSVNH